MAEETRRASDGSIVPVIPPLPDVPLEVSPNPILAVCGVCNRDVRKVESYVCGHDRCPVLRKATF
jgi:hypothetical protein